MLRTHTCGELRKKHIGKHVTLCGWIDTRRDHGNLIFLDVRDRWGKTQLVFDSEVSRQLHRDAEKLRPEFVIRVGGVVGKRPAGTANPKLNTGEIEVRVNEMEVLNASETPPFEILDESNVSEEIRLKYRYLDLRRPSMLRRLEIRSQVVQVAREYFKEHDFIEVETPILTKSTPEGARDFLVPSRLSQGTFYALPQSPQLFKQMLMVSGVDRYFQLARCFRDEDLRADRQPEHTQIDVEMSFVTEDDVISVIEGLLVRVVKAVCGVSLKPPLQRLSYLDAVDRYGTDAPDIRFGLELVDVTSILERCELKIFRDVIASKGMIKGINVRGRDFSRQELDGLIVKAKELGAQGLAWLKVTTRGFESPIAKFLAESEQDELRRAFCSEAGDTIFLLGGEWRTASTVLGALRSHLAKDLKLVKTKDPALLWVVNFPLFEFSEAEKRLESLHHPFTAPQDADVGLLDKEPLRVRARAYDIILNGTEIGGGSIRIHREEVQKKVFGVLGISDQEAEEKFGFLLEALRYGAPPHGGIALGLDRLCANLLGVDTIRDVIAFPKTQKGTCLMTEAPSKVYPEQLKELFLQVKT
ncbi:MAG: aspartate--tRNA ligase [Omnitrophica bacterium RIFCSPLOWO2_12_FULL_50_11]|nr:MAG: aspartate--tRNA ligase [Omnitrophica bacterium RIFCSPLOWO2_12_FULL_50_11]